MFFYYFKRTCKLWLTYSRSTSNLHGYIDTDRNIAKDYYSISSYTFLVNGSTNITKKALKLCSFIYEVFSKKFNTIAIFSDN